jgi:vancomycin resistance protein VanJ
MIAVWVFLHRFGDRTWLGTIAIFSPRWIVLLPLFLLVPMAVLFNRRCFLIVIPVTFIAIFAVMGLCIPIGSSYTPKISDFPVRVLTCNVHGRTLQPERLAALIADEHPDIIILQEWLGQYQQDVFGDGQWNVEQDGEHCVATRFPIDLARRVLFWSAVRYTLATPGGRINILNVHLGSPHTAMNAILHGIPGGKSDLEKNIVQRETEASAIKQIAGTISGPLIIAGDFNLSFDSPIFLENFGNLPDAFDKNGFGFGWTYRVKWTSVRIDHILTSGGWICRDCRVGPDIGSPHRPVIADFYLPAGQ